MKRIPAYQNNSASIESAEEKYRLYLRRLISNGRACTTSPRTATAGHRVRQMRQPAWPPPVPLGKRRDCARIDQPDFAVVLGASRGEWTGELAPLIKGLRRAFRLCA